MLMRILVRYWDFSFVIQMAVILVLMLWKYEKHRYFVWRFLGCLIVLGLVSYFINPMRWGLPHSDFFTVFNPFLRFGVIFGLCVVAIRICCKIDILNALFCGISAYAIQHICYSGINIFGEIFFSFSTNRILGMYLKELVYFVFVAIMYFLAIRKISEREAFIANNRHVAVMTVVVIITTILLHSCEDILHYKSEIAFNAVRIVCCVYRILLCSLIVAIQVGLLDRFILKNENDTLRNIQKMQKEKYELSKECVNLVNVKYHDLKHIVSKMESGKPYKHYVQEIKEGLNDYDLCVNSGNEILDVVLFEKLMICRKNDIKLIQAVDGALLSFMDEMDIYSFFGNILDNAIDGVSGLPADERIIYLTVGLKGAFVTASSANNCEREVKFSDGMPVTSKSDKANHGFGVRSMQIIAEKYNGEVSFSQKDNIFTVDAYFQAGNKAV